MRSDYGLYGVAIICFILAAVFAGSLVPGYTLSEATGVTVTVVFLLIGIIAAAVGYSARPKGIIPPFEPTPAPTPVTPIEETTPIAEETTTPPSPPPTPLEEVSASPEEVPSQPAEPSEPSPAVTPVEEPTHTEDVAVEKPKTTRRRRKKAAT